MKEVQNEIRRIFMERLSEKTNWGKNQIEEIYTQVEKDVYLEYLSKLMDR